MLGWSNCGQEWVGIIFSVLCVICGYLLLSGRESSGYSASGAPPDVAT